MRCIFSFPIFVAIVLVASVVTPSAVAQENYFLKITSTVDFQVYSAGGTFKITGLLQTPDSTEPSNLLLLRVQIYRPGKNVFVIYNEAFLQVKNTAKGDKKLVQFEGTLQFPEEEGLYLLRVDCLNRKEKTYPKSLVATQALFVKLEPPAKKGVQGNKLLGPNVFTASGLFGEVLSGHFAARPGVQLQNR